MLLCVPPSLEMRVPLSSGNRGSTSPKVVLGSASWEEGGQSPCTCYFSNSFSLRYSVCQDTIFRSSTSLIALNSGLRERSRLRWLSAQGVRRSCCLSLPWTKLHIIERVSLVPFELGHLPLCPLLSRRTGCTHSSSSPLCKHTQVYSVVPR